MTATRTAPQHAHLGGATPGFAQTKALAASGSFGHIHATWSDVWTIAGTAGRMSQSSQPFGERG